MVGVCVSRYTFKPPGKLIRLDVCVHQREAKSHEDKAKKSEGDAQAADKQGDECDVKAKALRDQATAQRTVAAAAKVTRDQANNKVKGTQSLGACTHSDPDKR